MSAKRSRPRLRAGAHSFVSCLRKFLTPAVWKQAHRVPTPGRRAKQRWPLQPMLLTILLMTWCTGDTQAERFETARAFYTVLAPKRRRPGRTVQGFQKSLAALPVAVLRALATALRGQLRRLFAGALEVAGFIPLGCDGTRLRCPRCAALERRLGQGSNAQAPPQVWVTALVHLATGLLWSWRIGKGNASERQHLEQLAPTLPPQALVVADAGYQGVDLARTLIQAGLAFLIRVSSQTTLYALEGVPGAWDEGLVYYWTAEGQRQKQAPLLLRLLRVHSPKRKVDVWLLTNVLESQRLSVEAAGQFYKMRWENEGFFRTYKRTLAKVKLQSRTVRLVHREVEGSLLAVQLLLAQGAWAMVVLGRKGAVSSPRGVLVEIRRELRGGLGRRPRRHYVERLARAERERRPRTSAKEKRVWPSRDNHKPPKPPKLRELTEELKALLQKVLPAA